jgi:drug/metabolite transporter (DMT)-like permease
MAYIGELAALFTSLCWAIAAVGFTFSSARIGPIVTNRIRVLIAVLALLILNAILYGQPIPLDAGGERWFWLMLSGVVGLALGDAWLFRSFQDVGPRIGLLLLSLAPVFGSALAWLFFGETLTTIQVAGVLVTLAGIFWVVLVRPAEGEQRPRHHVRGILFGVLGAIGQAGGLVLARPGLSDDFPPFAATLIRMIAAFVILWGMALLQKQALETINLMRKDLVALRWIAFGALFAAVIGISASLFAVQHAEIGVASTLMALPPVFMLPLSYFIFKERFNWQAVAGTLLAVAGVALLFLKVG